MLRRSTWIILVIFLALLGGAWYFQKYQAGRNAEITPTSEYKLLFADLDKAQITGIEIVNSQGKQFSVAMDESENWVVAGFSATDTNPYSIDDMLTKVTALTIMSELNPAPALDVIGLTTPDYILKVSVKDGKQKTAYIGSLTPTSSGYYARMENGGPVVVGKYAVDNLINFLDNPPVSTPMPRVTETDFAQNTPSPQP